MKNTTDDLRSILRAPTTGDRLRHYRQQLGELLDLRGRSVASVMRGRGAAAGCWIDCEDASGNLTLLTGNDADDAIDAAMGDAPEAKGGGR